MEEFLECGEMRYNRSVECFLNSLHVPNIFDKLAIMLVSIILEQNENE